MRTNKLIKLVAKEFKVSPKEVEEEMKIAIEAGRNNPDPEAQENWKRMFGDNDRTPSIEEFIYVMMKELNRQ